MLTVFDFEAQAQSFTQIGQKIEKVEASSLNILGRSIQNKETGESLAIACVGNWRQTIKDSCHLLRMVYVTSDRSTAYFVGLALVVSYDDAPTQKELKAHIKHLKHQYKKYLSWQRTDAQNFFRHLGQIGILFGVIFTVPQMGVAAGISTILGGGFTMFMLEPSTPGFGLKDGVNNLQNQSGWNWSEKKPGRLSNQKFDVLMGVWNDNHAIPAEYRK